MQAWVFQTAKVIPFQHLITSLDLASDHAVLATPAHLPLQPQVCLPDLLQLQHHLHLTPEVIKHVSGGYTWSCSLRQVPNSMTLLNVRICSRLQSVVERVIPQGSI